MLLFLYNEYTDCLSSSTILTPCPLTEEGVLKLGGEGGLGEGVLAWGEEGE